MAFKPTYHARNLESISKLADNTKVKATKWYNWCIENEVDILIYETIRTLATQKQYVANKVSKTLKSYHLVGQALDFVPIVNGKTDWNKSRYSKKPYITAIEQAEKIGFESGYRWGWDAPHLQNNYKGYGTDTFDKKVVAKPAVVKVTPAAKKAVAFPGLIAKGSKGANVGKIQKVVGVKVDNDFGSATEKAVKAYQKKNKLDDDGKIGKLTWNKMFN